VKTGPSGVLRRPTDRELAGQRTVVRHSQINTLLPRIATAVWPARRASEAGGKKIARENARWPGKRTDAREARTV